MAVDVGYSPDDLPKYKTVGKSLPRLDTAAKVTGQAKFTADYYFENML